MSRHQLPAEPVTSTTPRPLSRTVLTQSWQDLAFLHWPVEPASVAPLLPAGTRPDLHDGSTWVGLIGFTMVGLGFARLPGVPYLGTFPETNVRLYSVDDSGRRGVVFRSLDITRLLPALVSRVWPRVPYTWSRMPWPAVQPRSGSQSASVTYAAHRRWPRAEDRSAPTTSRFRVRPGALVVEPSPLEQFLTARWGLHTESARGRPRYLPNEHPAWTLHRAELLEFDDGPHGLVAAAGLPGVTAEPPVSGLFSPGLPVRFGPPLP